MQAYHVPRQRGLLLLIVNNFTLVISVSSCFAGHCKQLTFFLRPIGSCV